MSHLILKESYLPEWKRLGVENGAIVPVGGVVLGGTILRQMTSEYMIQEGNIVSSPILYKKRRLKKPEIDLIMFHDEGSNRLQGELQNINNRAKDLIENPTDGSIVKGLSECSMLYSLHNIFYTNMPDHVEDLEGFAYDFSRQIVNYFLPSYPAQVNKNNRDKFLNLLRNAPESVQDTVIAEVAKEWEYLKQPLKTKYFPLQEKREYSLIAESATLL